MLHAEPSPRMAADAPIGARLQSLAGLPLALARAMLAYVFVVEGYGKIVSYSAVADYMRQNGVAPTLLPLVIATELGGGLMVLFGFKTRWAAIALGGFCLLTALLFHMTAEETVQFQKNIAMAGGFLALAAAGPGLWSIDAWRARNR
jgi:putative oxidoreductase